MSNLRIVIFGARGHIGYEVLRLFSNSYIVLAPSRIDLDLKIFDDVGTYLRIAKPDLIINAASFSDIDLAENNVLDVRRLSRILS